MAGLAPTGYGPNPGQSGSDPRGRAQNQSQYQQQRFEQQQGPVANQAGYNYGRASTQGFQDYNDIMSGYANANVPSVSGGSVNYTDPFASYQNYQDLAKTGGYSAADMDNLRSRGTAPVRAAYANAGREVARQRSLQGGYSPNATATLAKMAREQGQSGADAMQNVEAGIVDARNRGQQAGMAGMAGIEGQRLNAQLDAGKFNAQQGYLASLANAQNKYTGLQGMTSLYGATPGMASTFGNQAIDAVNSGGNFGSNLYQNDISAQDKLPGQFGTTVGKIGAVADIGTAIANPIMNYYQNRNKGIGGGLPANTQIPKPTYKG